MLTFDPNLHRFSDLMNALDIGVCAFDAQDRALGWNRTFLALFPEHDGHIRLGDSYRTCLSRFYGARLGPEEMLRIDEHVARGLAYRPSQNRPFDLTHRGTGLRIATQDVPGLGRVWLFRQISGRRVAEFALREKADLLDAALEAMDHGLIMTDTEDRVRVFNQRAAALIDVPEGLLYDGAPYAAVRAFQARRGEFKTVPRELRRWLERGSPENLVPSYERERPDGTILEVRTTPLSQGGLVRVFRDVTEQRAAEARVVHVASHDALTGLPNRAFFRNRFEQRLSRRSGRYAVLCLDLDRFKTVNDTLGHAAGDALLCEVAKRMRQVLRTQDLVARVGGDEFVVLLDRAPDAGAACRAAKRLIEAMRDPFLLVGRPVNVGLSAGIALAPSHGEDVDTLMAHADVALYRAKAEGRGTFSLYEEAMGEAAAEHRRLELDLHLAVRRGEFVLHYQPIVAATDRRVIGYEALVRWNHPTRGEVPPSTFIPLAEETGLIIPLGAWVMRTACRDASEWADGTQVAVNVSAIQVRQGHVLSLVQSALSTSRLAPERLVVEITESVLMGADHAARDTLHALRALGVRIALDDFGTGYSSLSYLRRFPFDKIKIDRSFVADIADPNTAAIVRAVVGLGERLGATVTAEGVETEAQLEAVHAQGCQEMQGYLLGRPAPLPLVREAAERTNRTVRVA